MKKRVKKYVNQYLIFVAAILIFITVISLEVMDYFATENYIVADIINVVDNTIVIGKNCTAIVATTSPERARSIQLALEHKIDVRPTTHDTFVAVLRNFNITLEAAQIESFDGNYYYSNLILHQKDKILKLDAMPSDAIAIALRTNGTIYINKTLLQEVGKDICASSIQ